MSSLTVTVNLVVLNGEKYIRHCLDGILAQTYPRELIKFNILDNGSADKTKEVIRSLEFRISNLGFAGFNLIESKLNLGMWPGQEELLKCSKGKYVLAMAVDVILDKDFVKNAVEVMEKDDRIGGLEAKIFKYDLVNGQVQKTNIIDTCGFQVFKSRRITNIGHGELDFAKALTGKEDKGFDFNKQQEIFGVEGACPFFRREALESCRIKIQDTRYKIQTPEIFDHDYFWYGDDLDLAWRMNMFGWKQVLAPSVIAWHDRQTTKNLKKHWRDYISRIPTRQKISIKKRRLDWRNLRWTIIKNDYIINILRDLPFIVAREIAVFGYTILFESAVLMEAGDFFRLLPKMFRKRKVIMRKAKASPAEIRKYFK